MNKKENTKENFSDLERTLKVDYLFFSSRQIMSWEFGYEHNRLLPAFCTVCKSGPKKTSKYHEDDDEVDDYVWYSLRSGKNSAPIFFYYFAF